MNESFKRAGAGRSDPLTETDLTNPAIIADPHPTYAWLQQAAPVAWSHQLHGWIVTRYHDAHRALLHPALSVEKLEPFVAHSSAADRENVEVLGRVLSDWMVFKDPPTHTRLRRALKDAFMPAEIAELKPRVRAIVDELLDDLPAGEPVDFVERFAFPLPAMVIGDLFGLPRGELDALKAWSDDLGKFVLASTEAERDRIYRLAGQAVARMKERFGRLVEDHRREPRDDFTSRLIENAEGLSTEQIVHTLVLVLWAGHETTTNLLATAAHHMCRMPGTFSGLRAEPDGIPAAVEECLRADGPAHMLVRLAKEPLEIGGQKIDAGDRVYVMMNAANRDPAFVDDPHSVDFSRPPGKHLGFGRGIHMCLGAPLARLEGEQALLGLTERFSDIRYAGRPTEWRQNLIIRGPRRLNVVLGA